MADELRLRGQEVQLRITQGGTILRTLVMIENLTWTVLAEILRKSYLGQTTEMKDDIYKGTKVEFGFDVTSKEPFIMVRTLRDRILSEGSRL